MTSSKNRTLFSPRAYGVFCHCDHGFPSLWRWLLPDTFSSLKLPGERVANCAHCPMVAIGEYRDDCRCCTHLPQIPNFQLGFALLDQQVSKRFSRIIQQGLVLPEGMELPPARLQLFHQQYAKGMFGKNNALRCPLMQFDDGQCGAYLYRAAVCSTFFCSNDHGSSGDIFWDSLQRLVSRVELALSQWAMTHVGMDVSRYLSNKNKLAQHFGELTDENSFGWSPPVRQQLFGTWYGREESFFIECAKQVALHRDSLWTIACGVDIKEATEYERGVERLVALSTEKDSAASDEAEDEWEDSTLPELWNRVRRAHDRLWRFPSRGERVQRRKDVTIEANTKKDEISRYFKEKPFRAMDISMRREDEQSIVFLSGDEAAVIALLDSPQQLDDAFFALPTVTQLEYARDFISQCICNDILEIV